LNLNQIMLAEGVVWIMLPLAAHSTSPCAVKGDVRMPSPIRNVLSIAGSDPSGGAGIQADLKTFSARGTYGMAAITALTAQNTQGVRSVQLLPPAFVVQQIEAVFADIRVDAVKIGMIANGEIAEVLADVLSETSIPVVLDPVMIAKGGASLLDQKAVSVLVQRLLPKATLITPNLPEAAALLGENEAADRAAMQAQAQKLLGLGAQAVLLKGGHLPGEDSPDVLVSGAGTVWFEGRRINTANTHGTGCSLSSAIAAELAKGLSLPDAVANARTWLRGAVANADRLEVGSGHGPVHHFHALWGEVAD
jgi:hydroxymethylpyrimidine/phosphomethylpyrimidine kinase